MSKVSRIEVNFAEAVELPDGFEQVLCGLVDMACKQWERENPTMVMWPAGQGSKPLWSKADAAFLGVAATNSAPDSGEPEFDDTVYCIDVEAREDYHGNNPYNPEREKLRAEAVEARRKRRDNSGTSTWPPPQNEGGHGE